MKMPAGCNCSMKLNDGYRILYMHKDYLWIGTLEGAGPIICSAKGSSVLRFAKAIIKANAKKGKRHV